MSTDDRGALCLGIDLAWWGGSKSLRASRIETIIAATSDDADSLSFEDVELSAAPNPDASEYFEPNFDAEGRLLADAIAEVVSRFDTEDRRVIVALDAPLVARRLPGQLPRMKANFPGRRSGLRLRRAEKALHAGRQQTGDPGRGWNRDLKVQAGSPLPPRVERLVSRLLEKGFAVFEGQPLAARRQLIEVFPSEAIWWLGVGGYYGDAVSQEIRKYKAKTWRARPTEEAMALARRPLLGFTALFSDQDPDAVPAATTWIERIAAHAAFSALDPRRAVVVRNKRFDDVIESGLAFLTAVAFGRGHSHHWGEGDDGTIVGPGKTACLGSRN